MFAYHEVRIAQLEGKFNGEYFILAVLSLSMYLYTDQPIKILKQNE